MQLVTTTDEHLTAREPADAVVPLDLLLASATRSPLAALLPDSSTLRWAAALGRRPGSTGSRLSALIRESGRVLAGTTTISVPRRDRRFADPAWSENPLLRRLLQFYLACGDTAQQLVDDAELGPADRLRVSLLVDNLRHALAPSNVPLLNPTSAKSAVDSGGLSLMRGLRHILQDLSSAPRLPAMVEPGAFSVGEDLATSPGAVIFRNDQLELMQYAAQTRKVHPVPLLIVPPTINKYYVIDLARKRSFVEYATSLGHQVFVISWRNPDVRHSHWGFDTYVQAILDAHKVVRSTTSSHQAAMLGLCSGGILASIAAAHLAHLGRGGELAALLLAVTLLDQAPAGTASALLSPAAADVAKKLSRRRGFLDGADLAQVFAWLRPGDLIWNYWVNNYLLGKKPPSFDILFWNSDTVRMTSAMHADFLDLALDNSLTKAGALRVLGTPIDLSVITADAYVAAGSRDHITPWESCYKSVGMFGGVTRFVLSNGGHVAALVNPPGNNKAGYRVGSSDGLAQSSAKWLQTSEEYSGSWWTDALTWLSERSGEKVPAPASLGSNDFPPIGAAPGTYVFDK